MKHFHIYDTTGEVMCVDAADWMFSVADSCATFWSEPEEGGKVVATFNWSNVVCVREEEHDDDDDGEDSTPMPDYLQGVLN